MYADPVSVSGNLHAFTMVGIAANPSPTADSNIAVFGESTAPQMINASSEKPPQTKSKIVSFQKLLRLKKDDIITSNGRNPARKMRVVAHISAPEAMAAAVPIKGASAHIDQDTRFGVVFPETVSRIYAAPPEILISALPITNQ
jgi:hypothetical protein